MAARKGGELVYVGEVGTAFSRRMSTELRKLLEAIVVSLGRSSTASAWWPAHRGRPARLGCVPGSSCRPMVLGTLGAERLPFDEAFARTVFAGQAHSGQFDKGLKYKTPKLLLVHLIPSYKIDPALTHPLALPVLVVGFAADRISVSLLHTAERQFQRNSLTGNGQGFIYAP